MRQIIKAVALLMVLLTTSLMCSAKTIRLKANRDLQSQMSTKNATYLIEKEFNLKGKNISIPSGCVLKFRKGLLRNGTIIGDGTRIKAGKKRILENIEIQGSWDIDTVYSEWLEFQQDSSYDNRSNFTSLTMLSTGLQHTHIYMQAGEFWTSIKSEGYGFNLPSNTTLHSKATIREIANNYKAGKLISIFKAENVVIDGGRYVGDLETHTGEEGEWSHGIECRASKNVTIKNVEVRKFWGDGVDVIDGYDDNLKPTLNCYNVRLENIKSYYNRRAGIGLEAVINCKVINCECRYTGTIRGTMPKTGIGIEAWSNANEKIKNVEVVNCTFDDNEDKDLFVYANGPWRDDFSIYENNIVVRNCKVGFFFVSHTNGITLDNCEIRKSKGYEHQYVKRLKYVNSTLKGKKIHKEITNLPKKN